MCVPPLQFSCEALRPGTSVFQLCSLMLSTV